MPNESKIKDPRFWAKWRASGAVGDIDSYHRIKFPKWDDYQILLGNVRAGFLTSEPAARAMVVEHGLPARLLQAALLEGRPKHYEILLGNVGAGFLTSEPAARVMVEQYGLPVKRLEDALAEGAPKHYQTLLRNIRAGYVDSALPARLLVKQHGLPAAPLEAALVVGREARR